MLYGVIKTLHILSATILFGTGIGSAYYLWRANRTGDARVIAPVARHVVQADWLFTTPAVIFQPLSGAWMAYLAEHPWTGWLGVSIFLYLIAALCWLPVVWLQLKMRSMAEASRPDGRALPSDYWRYARIWFWLGVPAFTSVIGIYFLMVIKAL